MSIAQLLDEIGLEQEISRKPAMSVLEFEELPEYIRDDMYMNMSDSQRAKLADLQTLKNLRDRAGETGDLDVRNIERMLQRIKQRNALESAL